MNKVKNSYLDRIKDFIPALKGINKKEFNSFFEVSKNTNNFFI
jgi:hypothetical protein